MDKAIFSKIIEKIRTESGEHSFLFDEIKLISYDEQSHQAIIEVPSAIHQMRIERKLSHVVVNAFDEVMGKKISVICTHAEKSDHQQPHERFITK